MSCLFCKLRHHQTNSQAIHVARLWPLPHTTLSLPCSAPHARSTEVSFADRRTPCTSWTSAKKPNMTIANKPFKAILSSGANQCGKQCAADFQCTAFTIGLSKEGDLSCWFYAVKDVSRIKWKPSMVYTSGHLTCSTPRATQESAAQNSRPSSTQARPPNAGIKISVSKATAGAMKQESLSRASGASLSVTL